MLEIPALLWERSKPSGEIHLQESLKHRCELQLQRSPRKDQAPQCLPPCLHAPDAASGILQ